MHERNFVSHLLQTSWAALEIVHRFGGILANLPYYEEGAQARNRKELHPGPGYSRFHFIHCLELFRLIYDCMPSLIANVTYA